MIVRLTQVTKNVHFHAIREKKIYFINSGLSK